MKVVEVKIPQVGESITEGVLVEWARPTAPSPESTSRCSCSRPTRSR